MHVLVEDTIIRLKGSPTTFTNCEFTDNIGFTGGVFKMPSHSSVTVLNSRFINNTANSGGVIYFQGPGLLKI